MASGVEQDILTSHLIAIIRTTEGVDLVRVAEALAEGGVRVLEVTLNTPGALGAIKALRGRLPPDIRVGAGTILGAADVRQAESAGAEFIVTPTVQLDSIDHCMRHALPVVCGCSSPTEMLEAHRAGATFLKLFPATRYGPGYVADLVDQLPGLRVVPTGGVTPENVGAYLSAGAAAVAVGSQLADPKRMAAGDWAGIAGRTRAFVDALRAARGV